MIVTRLLKSKYNENLRSLRVDGMVLDTLNKVKEGDTISVVFLSEEQKVKHQKTSSNGNDLTPEAWLTVDPPKSN